jgi:hypothetical protein
MQAFMVHGARVRRPESGADRPEPWMLIAIALGALAAGLSVARSLTRDALEPAGLGDTHAYPVAEPAPVDEPSPPLSDTPPPPPASPPPPSPASAPPPTSAPAPATASPPSSAPPNTEQPIAATEAPPAPPPPAPTTQPPTNEESSAAASELPLRTAAEMRDEPVRTRQPVVDAQPEAADAHADTTASIRSNAPSSAVPQVELGIVAYSRCDGLPQLDKRFPCPRDLRLEARVRRAINDLERCALAPEQRGLGNVRLEFERDLPVRARVDSAKEGGFDRAAVSRCVGASLASVRTALQPDHMVIYFYFGLR